MRGSRGSGDRRYILRTDRRVYTYGQPVQTQMEVLDPQLLGETRDSITIRVTQSPGSGDLGHPAEAVPAAPGSSAGSGPSRRIAPTVVGEFDAHRLSVQSNVFEGVYVPPHPGGFALAPADPGAPARALRS